MTEPKQGVLSSEARRYCQQRREFPHHWGLATGFANELDVHLSVGSPGSSTANNLHVFAPLINYPAAKVCLQHPELSCWPCVCTSFAEITGQRLFLPWVSCLLVEANRDGRSPKADAKIVRNTACPLLCIMPVIQCTFLVVFHLNTYPDRQVCIEPLF